ncbi:MAG: 2,3-dehydroadipyl-CoA hydratase [Gammaproteobacteria bacterium]|jgi:enoyl-CoA hydratase|nr:2,3-dehydroadipyl-CoA hydratase [Gammaproteobacteria bacterium]MBT3722044.1 2,3-dehydroadipyl-CoA hydratase [Gammaproteobacteria bacterium]MBT4078802.1 2,3-dehydroadipyl-CoA hydratase [Gammaproteobacteria bacterium]MBT4195937.1 2,3-dehydroadipyl-CoA hydratase [Gammaproteobacteria bacterium]MBT4451591.1 2,3-dehydroadipyl-CoA hydratase [Gammaproteobacteria bacterium]
MKTYEDILIDDLGHGVYCITLNRPEARNALRTKLLAELADILNTLKIDDSCRCIVLTGGETVFAAGADVSEMASMNMMEIMQDERPKYWKTITTFPKPIVAAINGYALGGGCELAMHADIIIAGSNAQFGQPEINLGIIPGAGGTQRLIKTVGKALASKMVLTGEFIDANTALSVGLVAEITQPELSVERAIELAIKIAQKSPLAVQHAKACLLKSYETTLSDGLSFEHETFVMLAGTEDRNEGLAAFLEKRNPDFKGQ